MTKDLITTSTAQQLQAASDRLETLRLTAEAKALEGTLRFLESPQPVVVPCSEYPAFDQFNSWPSAYDKPFYWTSPEDRTEGRYRPIYETEQDLRRIRADARRLYDLFPVAQAAVECVTNYTIGNGWDFKVQPKKAYKQNAQALQYAGIVQTVLDRFMERTGFIGGMDRIIYSDSRKDGEVFATLYPDEKDVRLELTNPDFIVRPLETLPLHRMLGCGHKLNFWWHGVHTQFSHILKRDDYSRPLGYHAVYDKQGDQWDYLPAARVEHIKRNVGAESRRGISDFLIVLRDLESEAKLRRNTAEGAAILAAIVMIRQHAEGVSRSSIESMVSANSTSSYEKPTQNGSRTTYRENTPPGTVKDMPYGMQAMLGPLGQLRSPVYVEVDQFLLRVISTRWAMTEGMISGDSSNNNRASALVAEDPFVKAREKDQGDYARHYESLIWKAMAMYSKLGAFGGVPWQLIAQLLDINAEYTSPASRDKLQQAQTNKIMVDAGWMSDRSAATDMGLDPDEEIANGAMKAPPEPSPFGGGFGGPTQFESTSQSRLHELAAKALASLTEGK